MSPRIFHPRDAFTLREVDFYDSGRFYSSVERVEGLRGVVYVWEK